MFRKLIHLDGSFYRTCYKGLALFAVSLTLVYKVRTDVLVVFPAVFY